MLQRFACSRSKRKSFRDLSAKYLPLLMNEQYERPAYARLLSKTAHRWPRVLKYLLEGTTGPWALAPSASRPRHHPCPSGADNERIGRP